MSCDPWAPIRRRWRRTPCSGRSARCSLAPSWQWASPWRSRPSCRSVRPARSTRHRGSPSTGRCCCLASRYSASVSVASPSSSPFAGPLDATTNGGSPCGGRAWSRSPPGPVYPNRRSLVCGSLSSEAAVARPCPSAPRSRARVLAVAVLVATLTFGSSLATLDSHPALYGWNWSYAINSPGGNDVPPVVGHLLSRDPEVAAWTGYTFGNVQFNGLTVPVLLTRAHADLGPPILTGHAVDANNQVVLGTATLAALHKKLGDTVMVSYGAPQDAPVYVPPSPMVIVGTATMPAIGAERSSSYFHGDRGPSPDGSRAGGIQTGPRRSPTPI